MLHDTELGMCGDGTFDENRYVVNKLLAMTAPSPSWCPSEIVHELLTKARGFAQQSRSMPATSSRTNDAGPGHGSGTIR